MIELTNRTAQDASTMKIITSVTFVYLPATFVAVSTLLIHCTNTLLLTQSIDFLWDGLHAVGRVGYTSVIFSSC